jgi:16S rRNA G1207 methylase RsmC
MPKYRHIAVDTTYDATKKGKSIKVTFKMDQILEGTFINKGSVFADLSLDDGTEVFSVYLDSFKPTLS